MKTVDYYFHIALVPPNGSLKVVLEVTFSFRGHDFFFQNNFPLSHALKNPMSSFFSKSDFTEILTVLHGLD